VATAIKFMRPNGARYVPIAMVFHGQISRRWAQKTHENQGKQSKTNQNKPRLRGSLMVAATYWLPIIGWLKVG
jgi:hypothetical protein